MVDGVHRKPIHCNTNHYRKHKKIIQHIKSIRISIKNPRIMMTSQYNPKYQYNLFYVSPIYLKMI